MKSSWYHTSNYEKQGWISIERRLPEFNQKVRVASVRFLDWNLECLDWEGEGKCRVSNHWVIDGKTVTKELAFSSKVTHWRPLAEDEKKIEDI